MLIKLHTHSRKYTPIYIERPRNICALIFHHHIDILERQQQQSTLKATDNGISILSYSLSDDRHQHWHRHLSLYQEQHGLGMAPPALALASTSSLAMATPSTASFVMALLKYPDLLPLKAEGSVTPEFIFKTFIKNK